MKHLKLMTLALMIAASGLQAQKDSASEIYRPFQFTFITPLGTNGLQSFKTTNGVSLNLLVGVSRGVKGFEAGGIANVVLKDVSGAQFAGFSNVTLGSVQGGQFSSYFNYSGGNHRGVQCAGAGNVSMGELNGAQIAAGFNFNRKGGRGVQLAGHSNLVLGDFKGAQIATAVNIATGKIEGAQISAGVNIAKHVKGLQLGFINIADSVDGATIGFLNFVRKGKHQIELSGDELFYANVSYRTGTNAFYNIFTTGFSPGASQNIWHFGYGFGTSFKLKDKLWGDVSATIQHVSTGGFYFGTSELTRFYCGVDYKIGKKFSIAVGPTFNLYVSDELMSDYASSKKNLLPYYNTEHSTSNDFNLKGWVGGRIALRFF